MTNSFGLLVSSPMITRCMQLNVGFAQLYVESKCRPFLFRMNHLEWGRRECSTYRHWYFRVLPTLNRIKRTKTDASLIVSRVPQIIYDSKSNTKYTEIPTNAKEKKKLAHLNTCTENRKYSSKKRGRSYLQPYESVVGVSAGVIKRSDRTSKFRSGPVSTRSSSLGSSRRV